MEPVPISGVTVLLRAWTAGDRDALERLMPILYEELHRTARSYMRGERTGHTLQTSALVNEAYLRLVEVQQVEWQDRQHFFALAAQMMRRVLVDHARSRGFQKRGAGARQISLEEGMAMTPAWDATLLDLDHALSGLAELDPRKAQIIEMRFFAGFSVNETAEILGVSSQTVLRDWKLSKTWLTREMRRPI